MIQLLISDKKNNPYFFGKAKRDINDNAGNLAYKKGKTIEIDVQQFTPPDKRYMVYQFHHEMDANTLKVYNTLFDIENDFEQVDDPKKPK